MFPFNNNTIVQPIHAESLTDLTINQPEAHQQNKERAPGIIHEPEIVAHERSSFVQNSEINDPWGNSLLDHLKYLSNFNGSNIQPIPQEHLQKLNRINARILNNFYNKCSNACKIGSVIFGGISFSTYSQDSLFQVIGSGASIFLAVSGLFLSETFDGWQKHAFERAMREKTALFSKVTEIYHNLAKKLVEEYVHNMHSSSKGFRSHMPSHKRVTAQNAIRISKGILENIEKIKEGLFNIKLHNLDNDKIIFSTENRLNERLYLGNPYRKDPQNGSLQHTSKGCYLSYKYLCCCLKKCTNKEEEKKELECLKQERDQEINDIIIRLHDAAILILHLSDASKGIEDRVLLKNSMKEYYSFLEEYKKPHDFNRSSTPPVISPMNKRIILSNRHENKVEENESDELSSLEQNMDNDEVIRNDNSQSSQGLFLQRKKRSLKWTTDSHRQSHSTDVNEVNSVDVNELGNDVIVDIESKLGEENSRDENYRGPKINLFDLVNTPEDVAEIERIYRERFVKGEKEYTEQELSQIIANGSMDVREIIEQQQSIKKRRNEFVKWDICYKQFLAKKYDKHPQ